MTARALSLLLGWVGEQQPGRQPGGVNVLCCDFVDVSPFCSLVIGLNYKLLAATPPVCRMPQALNIFQHDVGVGAAAGALLEQAAALQRRRHAAQRPLAHAPHLAVAVSMRLPAAGRPVDYWKTVPVGPADDAVEILEFGGQEGPEGSLHPDGLGLSEALVVCAADAPHPARLRDVQRDQGVPGPCGQNTYRLVDLSVRSSSETWDLWVVGTEDRAGTACQVGIGDQVGLGIEGPGGTGPQSPGEPDCQGAFGSRGRRCRCWSGGLGSRVRMVLGVQAAPVAQVAHRSLSLVDQVVPGGRVGQRLSRLLGPGGTRTERFGFL
ncbi:hypothetical protein FQN60_006736 [Etheostoma spectabile]|uniref:Uncharacterized protein n=1 Tax=Etheostoma spectabile TaxID=54343 RepID=A0A5J5CF57_9PERO|nr:hypothetical protein FQN60_006736 [Etheostoma spectabile]